MPALHTRPTMQPGWTRTKGGLVLKVGMVGGGYKPPPLRFWSALICISGGEDTTMQIPQFVIRYLLRILINNTSLIFMSMDFMK